VVELIPWKAVQDFIEVVDMIYNTSVKIFESKKQALAGGDDALERQIAQGKDIMSILCELYITFEFVWFFDVLVDNFPQYVPICKPIRRIGCQKRN